MGIRLQKAIFHNRAPFDHLELNFDDSNVFILSGINGRGKTTIISHIVDSFYEMARPEFQNEFEGRSNKYYRVSSPLQNLDFSKPSFVYLRYEYEGKNIDYIDVRNICTEKEYNEAITIINKIPFHDFSNDLNEMKGVKYLSKNEIKINEVFYNNLLTYFPAYRYEKPGYLNNPYQINIDFKKETGFSGFLYNPIEVVSDLPNIANWLMDVVLDKNLYQNFNPEVNHIWENIQNLIALILCTKTKGRARIGIGQRKEGSTRLQILEKFDGNEESIYPSIFNISSGEAALLCMFGEILKQSDKINKDYNCSGIVLIDEIDKHLHIKMQKEVLPKLIEMFPHIQFIVSSHSPFFNIGLSRKSSIQNRIFDLENGGIISSSMNDPLYEEVYEMMLNEKKYFANELNQIKLQLKNSTKPLLITEGKTDIKHLKTALKKLNIIDLDFDFYELEDGKAGDATLLALLTNLALIKQDRKIIGMFDRDNNDILKSINSEDSKYKSLGNNVFSFIIPLVNEEIYGPNISIEQYFKRDELTKKNPEGRRIFVADEFFPSGNSKDGNYQTRVNIQNKLKVNGIIDEKVFDRINDLELKNSIAMTKDDFADLVSQDFGNTFDFSNFRLIFDVIKEIINSDNIQESN